MIQAAHPLQVAVIGAGISGVLAAAYLKNAGLQVTVFERANVAGGVWFVVYLARRAIRQLTQISGSIITEYPLNPRIQLSSHQEERTTAMSAMFRNRR